PIPQKSPPFRETDDEPAGIPNPCLVSRADPDRARGPSGTPGPGGGRCGRRRAGRAPAAALAVAAPGRKGLLLRPAPGDGRAERGGLAPPPGRADRGGEPPGRRAALLALGHCRGVRAAAIVPGRTALRGPAGPGEPGVLARRRAV